MTKSQGKDGEKSLMSKFNYQIVILFLIKQIALQSSVLRGWVLLVLSENRKSLSLKQQHISPFLQISKYQKPQILENSLARSLIPLCFRNSKQLFQLSLKLQKKKVARLPKNLDTHKPVSLHRPYEEAPPSAKGKISFLFIWYTVRYSSRNSDNRLPCHYTIVLES